LCAGYARPAHELLKALADIKHKDFSLVSLHDRPAKTKIGEYVYVLELSGGNPKELKKILSKHSSAVKARILGSFSAM